MARRVRFLFALALALTALVAVTVPTAAEDVYSPRTLEIARRLQCPVCAGQPVADSNSTLARQMRDIIEQKVQAGETDEQILAYFAERYGTSVLLDPPRSGIGLGLWWMPVVVVVIGGLVVFSYLTERRGRGGEAAETDESPSDDELESIARDVLGGAPDQSVMSR